MTVLSVKEETLEALNLLRREDEDDDSFLRRIVEYARCYMIIKGAEDVDNFTAKKEAENLMSAEERNCLECGGPLVKSKFVDEWSRDGRHVELVEDWYCPSCKIRWVHLYDEPYEEAEANG